MTTATPTAEMVTIGIGGTAIGIRSGDAAFCSMLAARYAGFVLPASPPDFELDVELVEPSGIVSADDDVRVKRNGQQWELTRGDFRASWNVTAARGQVRQANNPYAIDSVLRIMHTLILARRGGFLLHAASAIRHNQASLFCGISGAGKTTISRLAPADAQLLTDEISYVVKDRNVYRACGTPFAGELARVGVNQSAPIQALFFLEKAPENRIENVGPAEAVRLLLRNVLFFAEDAELVKLLFASACEFVDKVPVRRLYFVPDERVWRIIA
jgi:hypothetical protein